VNDERKINIMQKINRRNKRGKHRAKEEKTLQKLDESYKHGREKLKSLEALVVKGRETKQDNEALDMAERNGEGGGQKVAKSTGKVCRVPDGGGNRGRQAHDITGVKRITD